MIKLAEILNEAKKKGADGKACWDGYRHIGTKDGKDDCVKVMLKSLRYMSRTQKVMLLR